MNCKITKVFVGYQIASKFHSSDEIKTVMCQCVAPIVKEDIGINIEFKFGDKFSAGEYIFSQVHSAILESEIAIFDVSENNPNVLIEIGIAYGAGKFTIVMKNKSSNDTFRVPSDIGAFIYLPYDKLDEITNDIITAVKSYNQNHIPSHFYFKELWGFIPNDTVYIVCPELGDPEKKQNPELNEFLYLSKYGDIDSFVVLFSSLSKLYPNINLKFCTCKEFSTLPGNPHSEHLILLGGPDYNEVTRYYIEKKKLIPYEFVEVDDETEELGIKHPHSEDIYVSTFETNENLKCIKDYGFFVKTKNPTNTKKKIFLVNGIHTYGVYGAAKCFSIHDDSESDVAKENCKTVIHTLGNNSYFAALFPVNCFQSKIEIPSICEQEIISL